MHPKLKYIGLMALILFSQGSYAQSDVIYPTPYVSYGIEAMCLDLLSETGNFEVDSMSLERYFEGADTISKSEAIRELMIPTRYFVLGRKNSENTFGFFLFPSGIAVVMSEPVVFLRGDIEMPQDRYEPYEGGLRVLGYLKACIDPYRLEEWARNEEYGHMYREGGELYQRYENWKDNVFVNEIHRAFELCQPVNRYSLNVLWNVDHNCHLSGIAIREGRLWRMSMNGGGVIFLYGENNKEEQSFACSDPAGEAFFTWIIDYDDIL